MPFRDVVGHRRLVTLLRRSIQRESLPPSLIFAGPSGVGKRLVATATAQTLNCTSRVERDEQAAGVDACGVCAPCSRIARGVHPDVLVVEPGETGAIRIEQVRDVIDRAAYRPFEGRRRVVIVDEADALVPAAQNALLKTLEEPPPSSVFILVTPRPDVLLPTVRSRCPRLVFQPLGEGDVAAALMARGTAEADARAVASRSGGSLRAALDEGAEDLHAVGDVAERVLMQAASSSDPARRIEGARDLLGKTSGSGAADREQLASCLRAMSTLLRDVELLSTCADDRGLANVDRRAALERLTRAYGGDRGIRAFQAVDRALVALDRNASVKIVADWLVLEI